MVIDPPGIGTALAKKIIDNRPYCSTADITKVKGADRPWLPWRA